MAALSKLFYWRTLFTQPYPHNQGGRGQWTVNYTGPQGFIKTLLIVALKLWELLLIPDWVLQTSRFEIFL